MWLLCMSCEQLWTTGKYFIENIDIIQLCLNYENMRIWYS